MTAKQLKRKKKSHKPGALMAGIVAVMVFLVLSSVLIAHKTSEVTGEGAHTLCTVIGENIYTTSTYGWPAKTFTKTDNVCEGATNAYFASGIILNTIPGLIIAGGIIAVSVRYLRKKYAIIASR